MGNGTRDEELSIEVLFKFLNSDEEKPVHPFPEQAYLKPQPTADLTLPGDSIYCSLFHDRARHNAPPFLKLHLIYRARY
jgi:hypothetical protein